ncbi:sulfur carrier protein ThiS [Staphylococcus warneri]|uniref:sulfur carrier protein ThiS n=1 Tax=Staphylococcus warneri TaxID=1292 RepID=UPI002929054B|nr:sulfur carrier protein ThiS [Staphylococcus warneri]MDU9352620.1 sulfur carrier protein ThiS [Staphylococcus warneri]
MKCIINGNLFTFEHEDSITRILESLELDPQRVVVEHNQSLIKQDDFDNQIVREDDRLELLEFVGGG